MQEVFEATVTMFNTKNELQFIDRPSEDTNETKSVSVPPNYDVPVSFLVTAMKLGELEIRVNASIMQGVISDSFKKIIIVLPEDVIVRRSERIHFNGDTPSNQSFDIPLLMDNTARHDSIPVDLTVYPDEHSLNNPQNNCNLLLYYDGFIKRMHVNSEFKENITTYFIPANVRKLSVIITSSGFAPIRITNDQASDFH
ncbi:uncharacterized protein LOC125955443 [Anopheles darlingi]|uniref:uncharacterized protein LOC125955443 n=1 Tax=Anopheles darlingi TaxID=43151 RepID=UPI0021000321|nr:uncharacterized protein LOC125955443 [Anopheles darlingi]